MYKKLVRDLLTGGEYMYKNFIKIFYRKILTYMNIYL